MLERGKARRTPMRSLVISEPRSHGAMIQLKIPPEEPVGFPGPALHFAVGDVEAAGGEAAEPVEDDAQQRICAHARRSSCYAAGRDAWSLMMLRLLQNEWVASRRDCNGVRRRASMQKRRSRLESRTSERVRRAMTLCFYAILAQLSQDAAAGRSKPRPYKEWRMSESD